MELLLCGSHYPHAPSLETGSCIALSSLVHSVDQLIIELLMLPSKVWIDGPAKLLFAKEVRKTVLILSAINFALD